MFRSASPTVEQQDLSSLSTPPGHKTQINAQKPGSPTSNLDPQWTPEARARLQIHMPHAVDSFDRLLKLDFNLLVMKGCSAIAGEGDGGV